MSEVAINGFGPITTADTPDVDLHVENGTITDGNGNAVAIGEVYNETERARGKENAAVTAVADGTPTGTLQTDGNGNIAVEGHGTVTLVGDRRRVTTVGGANRNVATLKTDSNGDVFGEFVGSKLLSDEKTKTLDNTSTQTLTDFSTPDGPNPSDFQATGEVVANIDANTSGEYAIEWVIEASGGETYTQRRTGRAVNRRSEDGDILFGFLSDFRVTNDDFTVKIRPFKDFDNDSTDEYFGLDDDANGDISMKSVTAGVNNKVNDIKTPSVSLFDT